MQHLLARLLSLVMVGLLAAAPARSAEPAGPAYVVTYVEALPNAASQAAGLIRQHAAASRNDAGNVRFEALQRLGQPNHFVLVELWSDQSAQVAHAALARTKDFRSKLQPLLRAPYDERPHTALSVGSSPASAAESARGAIYAVTHVDIIPTAKDKGIEAAKQLSESGRNGKDNLRFELLQQNSRPNHMTVVEVWQNRKALDEHSTVESTRQFRETLLPMSGSLYDERLYEALK